MSCGKQNGLQLNYDEEVAKINRDKLNDLIDEYLVKGGRIDKVPIKQVSDIKKDRVRMSLARL